MLKRDAIHLNRKSSVQIKTENRPVAANWPTALFLTLAWAVGNRPMASFTRATLRAAQGAALWPNRRPMAWLWPDLSHRGLPASAARHCPSDEIDGCAPISATQNGHAHGKTLTPSSFRPLSALSLIPATAARSTEAGHRWPSSRSWWRRRRPPRQRARSPCEERAAVEWPSVGALSRLLPQARWLFPEQRR